MYIPRKQNDFAATDSERTSAKTDVDRQDRPPSEIYLETRPSVFRVLETGRWQSRFRVCRKVAARCEASSAQIRRQNVSRSQLSESQPRRAPAIQSPGVNQPVLGSICWTRWTIATAATRTSPQSTWCSWSVAWKTPHVMHTAASVCIISK